MSRTMNAGGYLIPEGRPVIPCPICGARVVVLTENKTLVLVEVPEVWHFGHTYGTEHICKRTGHNELSASGNLASSLHQEP